MPVFRTVLLVCQEKESFTVCCAFFLKTHFYMLSCRIFRACVSWRGKVVQVFDKRVFCPSLFVGVRRPQGADQTCDGLTSESYPWKDGGSMTTANSPALFYSLTFSTSY